MKTPIFQFEVKDVLKLWITGQNEGRLDRYKRRLGLNGANEDSGHRGMVEYKSSRKGKWTFPEFSHDEDDVVYVKQWPVFFETRYQVHCKFLRPVKNARVMHVMRSVSDEFDYDSDGRQLCGPISFINQPGRFVLNIRYDMPNNESDSLDLEWLVVSEKMVPLAKVNVGLKR